MQNNIVQKLKTSTLIIGGGPAGAALAIRLNRLGISNIIIEKEKFPRPKLCAGAISARALQICADDIDIQTQAITPIDTAVLHFRAKRPITRKMKSTFVYIVDRQDFDAHLLEKAIQSGSHVIYADSWCIEGDKLITGDTEIEYGYLAGCDGAYSRVRRHMGLGSSNGLGAEVHGTVNDDKKLHIYYAETNNGYGWAFPAKNGRNSLGIARLDNTKRKIKGDFNEFVKKLNINKPIDAHVIPIYEDNNVYAAGNMALAGDAAHLADHVLGEGIYYAISSGMILADSIDTATRTGERLDKVYPKNLEPLTDDLRNSAKIARIIYSYPALCHWLASLLPVVIDIYQNLLATERYAYTGMKRILSARFGFMRIFFPRRDKNN